MRGFLAVSLVVVSFILDGCGGCGDDSKGGSLADAPPLVDTPPDMMVPPSVTLTVTKLGEPVAGVHVYFVNADDSLVKTVDTDASGNASAVMAAGGSVTAINPFLAPVGVAPTPKGKGGDELRTFLGVKPGDHLFLTQPLHEGVSFQIVANVAEGANTYDVITSCGTGQLLPGGAGGSNTNPGGTVNLEDCHGAADIALITSNVPPEGATQLLQGLYHPNATVMADHTVDLTADDYTSLVDVSLTFPNGPDATMSVQHAPIGAHGLLSPFSGTGSGGTVTLTEPDVSAGSTKAVVDLQVSLNSQHEVVDWGPYTLTYMLDMQNLLLAEFTNGPNFDVPSHKVQWSEADTGGVADLTLARLRVFRSEPQSRTWHWGLAAAHPTTGEIKLPVLPTDVFDWTPVDSDSISVDPLTSMKVPGGYDAVRAHIFDIVEQGSFGDLVAGDSGRALSVTSLAPR